MEGNMKAVGLLRTSAALILALGAVHCAQEPQEPETAQPVLETEADKTVYAVGFVVAGNTLGAFQGDFSEEEIELVISGFRDALLGNEPRVVMDEYGPKLNDYLQQRTQARWAQDAADQKGSGADYLAQAAAAEGAVTTESGLVYTELVLGTGETPGADATVRVHYHGTLVDGTVFSSSLEQGEPIVSKVSGLIPGWQEGLKLIRVGGKARLVIPPELAYGDRPVGEIPPGSTLIFELELLGIE
jgi:FKBP-type peptidyl-prolyl cis-trans isomerase FkpA